MQRSESIAALGAALAKAQAAIEGAAKDSSNPHFGNRYADLASIVEACRAPLAANGLAVLQFPSADGTLVRLTTLLVHSSGEWIESDMLQVQTASPSPQSVGSGLTYLRRYQLAAVVGVAPDDDDGEAAEGRKPTIMRGKAKPAPVDVDPMTGEELTPLSAMWSGAPAGTHYLTDYKAEDGGWHSWIVPNWTAEGDPLRVSTRLANVADDARHACEARVPVKLKVTMKKGTKGEAYLNKVEEDAF